MVRMYGKLIITGIMVTLNVKMLVTVCTAIIWLKPTQEWAFHTVHVNEKREKRAELKIP